MNQNEIIRALQDGAFDPALSKLYACRGEALAACRQRYIDAVLAFGREFGESGDIALFSAPGRTELCGNHTDHQGGHVLAASVDLDIIAVAAKRDNGQIRLKSEGFPMDCASLSDLTPQPEEVNTSTALLRGIAAKFTELGHPVTGFDAYTTSNVLRGSGLSSSAAFEVLVGNICSAFFADGAVDAVQIAQIGQYAENVFFGKPCGLMDQMACSAGGVIAIDFREEQPKITRTDVDLAKEGYALCILDSGADHADLTGAYAAIPEEMQRIAKTLGKDVLSQVKKRDFYANLRDLRNRCGDRAVLRAMHYFADDDRVTNAVRSLQNGYFSQYLEEITRSGHSSFEYLQNVSVYDDPMHMEVALTIALCEELLGDRGAVRVHGGGFAGTVQAYVPLDMLDDFKSRTEQVLGKGRCHVMQIRSIGGTQVKI
ncbi:MAG: galactokinase [Oscillospiraceae bacterium]|nr:galactokinase [Oscillospiraceae bacterium]